jgi:hypothetical protein
MPENIVAGNGVWEESEWREVFRNKERAMTVRDVGAFLERQPVRHQARRGLTK